MATSRTYLTRGRRRDLHADGGAVDMDGDDAAAGNAALTPAAYWASPAAAQAWGVVEVDRRAVPGGRKFFVTPLVWGFASREEAALYGAIVTRVLAAYADVPEHKAARVIVPFGAPPCTIEAFGQTLALPADADGAGLVVTCAMQTMREATTLFEDAYVPHVREASAETVERMRRQHRQKERRAASADGDAAVGALAAQHVRLEDAEAARVLGSLDDDRAALHALQARVRAAAAHLPAAFMQRPRQGLLVTLAAPPRTAADGANDSDGESDSESEGVPALLTREDEQEEARLIAEEAALALAACDSDSDSDDCECDADGDADDVAGGTDQETPAAEKEEDNMFTD